MKFSLLKKKIEKCVPIVNPLFFVSLCFVIIYVSYGVYYQSNDDTGIMKWFSGYSTGVPNPIHQYGSYTAGLIYKLLYTIKPTWNWYSFFQIAIEIISNTVIIFAVYELRNHEQNELRYIDFLFIGLFVIASVFYGFFAITWTMNSLFSALAGTMLMLSVSQQTRGYLWRYVIAVSFMIVAVLTRASSYVAVLPFAVIVLFYRSWIRFCKEGKEKLIHILIELILLLLPLLAILGFNRIDVLLKSRAASIPQSNSDYYNSFEYYRGLYTDSGHLPYKGNEEFFDSIGWDAELMAAASDWMFIDPRFNTENLKKIAEATKNAKKESSTQNTASSLWNSFVKQTKKNTVRIVMSSVIVILLVVSLILTVRNIRQKRGWHDWVFLSATLLLTVAEWCYLIYVKNRFIDRSYYCATIPAICIGIWIIAKHASVMERKKWLYAIAGVLAIGAILASTTQYLKAEYREKAIKRSSISQDAEAIYYNHPENLYIYDTSIISGTYLFLDMNLRGCGNNALMWGGTGVFSTSFYEKIAQFGYDEFYSDSLFDENVLFITTNTNVWDSTFMEYMKKCYGESVDAELVDYTVAGVRVYKFTRENND